MSKSVTLNDVRDAARSVVHQSTELDTSRFVNPAQADPVRRLDYQNHPRQRRMYVHEVHGNPANLVGQVLAALGLRMPAMKRNEERFRKDLDPAYAGVSKPAERELQRLWDADAEGQHWTEIVSR